MEHRHRTFHKNQKLKLNLLHLKFYWKWIWKYVSFSCGNFLVRECGERVERIENIGRIRVWNFLFVELLRGFPVFHVVLCPGKFGKLYHGRILYDIESCDIFCIIGYFLYFLLVFTICYRTLFTISLIFMKIPRKIKHQHQKP